ncbi:hypothetical protein K413DRAFT_0599 [Clostridium sp. ASBs410]|nr:hypothetical protein K413DRAFT_0599 [Clostridium sp. ASBs410]
MKVSEFREPSFCLHRQK